MHSSRSGSNSAVRPRGRAWLLASLLLAGCVSYGGKHTRLRLVTVPDEAEAFVVAQERWYAGGKALYQTHARASDEQRADARRALLDWLEGFRVRTGRTPVEVAVVAHQQVFVALLGNEIAYTEFDPLELPVDAEDGMKFVSLELSHDQDQAAP